MNTEKLQALLNKMLAGELSQEEQAHLRAFMQQENNRQRFVEAMEAADADPVPFRQERWLPVIRQVVQVDKPQKRAIPLRKWAWTAAAAAVIIGMAIVFRPSGEKQHTVQADVAPGRNGAVLKLADGSEVVLDSLGNGMVASQNGARILLNNGQLTYTPTGNASGTVAYNTMYTPKGRQFQLTLPDGTKVWLNAASSIRYPTAFAGKERKVEITGEAYFEVAQDATKPFKVNAGKQATIDVLGTSFNVSAYADESSLNTTLVDGSIRIQGIVLKPGQQAQLAQELKVLSNIDVSKVVAWKNGLFNFDGMRLKEVMQQLERWYDIAVVYEGKIPDITFSGELNRSTSLSGLIKALEYSGLHFKIEGKQLTVLP